MRVNKTRGDGEACRIQLGTCAGACQPSNRLDPVSPQTYVL
jgi:hypothetical protein